MNTEPRTILCFGDSNTWGADPVTDSRFPLAERWPGVLRQELGSDYWVIEEGLPGRTTVWSDPIEGYKSGKEYLIPCLDSHQPLDLVIILLGTNDLKARFSLPAQDIANGAGVLVKMVQQSAAGLGGKAPQVLLIAPPPVADLSNTVFEEMFAGAAAKSRKFTAYYQHVAALAGCFFLDAASIVKSSSIDGVHLEGSEHLELGKAVANFVRSIF